MVCISVDVDATMDVAVERFEGLVVNGSEDELVSDVQAAAVKVVIKMTDNARNLPALFFFKNQLPLLFSFSI